MKRQRPRTRGAGATRRVTLVRTGGFAGIRRQATIDTGDLPPKEAAALLQCIEGLRLAGSEGRGAKGGGQPDRFCYTLTLEDGGSSSTVSFREGEEPPGLRPLLAALVGTKHPTRRRPPR
ncbi:MAG: protealysin inhibitor emfourin [Thermoanaerobaculia bacterium]